MAERVTRFYITEHNPSLNKIESIPNATQWCLLIIIPNRYRNGLKLIDNASTPMLWNMNSTVDVLELVA